MFNFSFFSFRFSVGVAQQLSETFESFIKKHQEYDSIPKTEEVPSITVIPPSNINATQKSLHQAKSKEGFLEHLLEVDNIENGHTQPSDQAVDDKDRILQDSTFNSHSSFIETRNYLAEKGIVITPTNPHKQTLYVVKGDKILGSKEILTSPGNDFQINRTENSTAVLSPTGALSNPSENSPASSNKMSYTIGGYTAASPPSPPSSSRVLQEELHQLNERFSSYVQRVRQLGEQANVVDTSAFLKSTKSLEQEINNLKNLYEQELQKLRLV